MCIRAHLQCYYILLFRAHFQWYMYYGVLVCFIAHLAVVLYYNLLMYCITILQWYYDVIICFKIAFICGDITITSEGQHVGLGSALTTFEQGLSCHTCCEKGPYFCVLSQMPVPFSHFVRQARGNEALV